MAIDPRGWADQPDGRGTFDILQTCCGTIALLCWSSVCPNVPSPKSGRWTSLNGKIQLFMLALLGPDFVYMIALGQLNAAWRLKQKFNSSDSIQSSWGLRQCFFVNMGGIHVQFENPADENITFPVDGDQLLFLLSNNFVALPDISNDEIEERNKTDELSRTIAIVQCLWFTINSFGRIAQGLHITTLEITTLAFIFLMSACVVFWWRKPMDIRRPIVLSCEISLAQVVAEAANSMPPGTSIAHGATPLSFYSRQEWFLSKHWISYVQILRYLGLASPKEPALTADHFPSIEFPETQFTWELATGPLIVLYSAIFMAAWNNTFSTYTERNLWRIASLISLLYGAIGCIIAFIWHNGATPRDELSQSLPWVGVKGSPGTDPQNATGTPITTAVNSHIRQIDPNATSCWPQILGRLRNISPDNDPNLAVSLRVWMFTTILCVVYSFARAFILIEDFVGLRDPPESTFKTVDWGQYSPIL